MTCSTPVNPFKQRKPFTSVWFVCLPVTKNGPSKSQISMPKPVCFARIDPSVNIGSASHPFQEISICHKEQLTRLYRTPCRNFLKEVLITWLTWGWETAGVTDQLSTCVSLSEGDLGTTHVVPYRIKMDNVFQYDNSRDEPHPWNMMSLNDK